MTGATLVRYIGPLAAYRGAIGWSADSGAIIGGRLRRGEVAPARYQVMRDDCRVATRSTWADGCIALAHATGGEVAVDAAPDPSGLEVTVGEHVYRLEVV